MDVAWIHVAVFLTVCVLCGFQTCPKNCKKLRKPLLTCNKVTSVCIQGCINGYYGKTCNLICDDKCMTKTCHQQDGSCICKDGYKFNAGSCFENKGSYVKGVKCKSTNHCLDNMCISPGREDCLRGCMLGWFGSDCKEPCADPRSVTCEDSCNTGSFGPKCEFNCSQHCVSGCDQLSGECAQCEAGWYGPTCQSECSAGCAGSYKDCDKEGTCIRGCVEGYFGVKCEVTCPVGCYGDVCDLNGTCRTCKPRFYGSFCHQTCNMCVDEICDMIKGTCTKGCRSGYYGTVCDLACVDCKGADCNRETGECKGTLMPYIIAGGVISVVVVCAVFIICCLKRIHNNIYIDVKLKRRSPTADASAVVPPGDIIVTPPTVCPVRLNRQTSYIRPRQSGSSTNNLQIRVQVAEVSDVEEDELQVANAPTLNLPPSDRQIHNFLGRSNEWLDRPVSYVLPNYFELNEDLMDSHPQQTQGAKAPDPVLNTSQFYAVADVHRHLDDENATQGEISIPLIAECFGTTDADDSDSDKHFQPENYDHPFKDYM